MEENKNNPMGEEDLNIPGESELPTPMARPELPEESAPRVYRWDYTEFGEEKTKQEKSKRKNGAMIYAVSMTCAFGVCFILLLTLLLSGAVKQLSLEPVINTEIITEERVVYVKEYDPSSGVLTDQEIYDTCSPAIVTISAVKGDSYSSGSGFIISEDGYIVTANHVIENSSSISIMMKDGKEYPAERIDGNEFTDLALIKIRGNGLPYLKIGSSKELLMGDRVVAIGSPASYDFAGSMVNGIVSYNERRFKIYNDDSSVEKKMNLIQTNALVNPGNSGCPLINQYGEVVGVVTMKLNSTYYEGMCFAIPTDSAMPIIYAMRDGADYSALLSAVSSFPAKLGITGSTYADEAAKLYGVRVESITSANYDSAGKLQKGDVIVSVNSTAVTSISGLVRYLDNCDPGDSVLFTFYRNGQKLTVNITLGE